MKLVGAVNEGSVIAVWDDTVKAFQMQAVSGGSSTSNNLYLKTPKTIASAKSITNNIIDTVFLLLVVTSLSVPSSR
jgi:hypothetical protein